MAFLRRETAVILCALVILFITVPSVRCWNVTPRRSLELIRSSEEAGRLRRGFHSSSLATARGFGKRSSLGTIPFVSSKSDDMAQARSYGRKLDFEGSPLEQLKYKDGRFPISTFVQLLQMDNELASNLVSKFVDADGDGFLTVEELERLLQKK